MRTISLKRNQNGVGAAGVIAIVVVIVIIVVAAVLVGKHGSKKNDNDSKTTSSSSQPTNSGTKSITGVTLSSDLSSGATDLAADSISKANENQSSLGAYFTISGGKQVTLGDSSSGVVEWGPTQKKVEDNDFASYVKKVGDQSYSGATVTLGSKSTHSLKVDNATYDLTCYGISAQKSGQTDYAQFCLGEVQKSSLFILSEASASDAAQSGLTKLLNGTTVNLQ